MRSNRLSYKPSVNSLLKYLGYFAIRLINASRLFRHVLRTSCPVALALDASELASSLIACTIIAHGYRGDKGIRTLDPLLARQVLSQLSYTPMGIWQPPALPYRLQYSTIGRLGLNHRVRDENGCVPQAHRHQKCSYFGFLHRRCALRITTSSLSFFLIYLFGKSTVMQPLLLPFP